MRVFRRFVIFGLWATLFLFACGKPAPAPTPAAEPEPVQTEPMLEQPKSKPRFVKEDGFCSVAFDMEGSLASSIKNALPDSEPYAENIAAQLIKALFWDLDHKSDLRKGDRCRLIYKKTRDRLKIRMYGIEYNSKKLDKRYLYFFFWERDKALPEYFDKSGVAVARRMKHPPLRNEAEIISLFRKGTKTKKGIKYRIPVGTQIVMPYPAIVERINWDLASDGLSVEVRYPGTGLFAQFVHLSAISSKVTPGEIVSVGTVFARTVVSGKTQIPHLEYRLLRKNDEGVEWVDPFELHGFETYTLLAHSYPDFVLVKHQILARLDKVGFDSAIPPEPGPVK